MFWLLAFLIHNTAITLFRMIGALARNLVVANALGSLVLLVLVMLGGFSLSKHYIHPWWSWACELHPPFSPDDLLYLVLSQRALKPESASL